MIDIHWEEPAWRWFEELDETAQKRIAKIVDLLEMKGRGLLGTKYAKKLKGHEFLHELVIDCKGIPFRPLFCFVSSNPETALIVVGGDKKRR